MFLVALVDLDVHGRLGIRRFARVGGAQAIAALAYGTGSIPRVDKIFGPGNRFVTAVGLLKLLLQARTESKTGERSAIELALRTRTTEEEVGELLSEMERLGYIRQLAASQSGRAGR